MPSRLLGDKGTVFGVRLDQERLVELSNAPRTDVRGADGAGPVKLRLSFVSGDAKGQVMLSAILQPQYAAGRQWMTLTGSADFEF